MKKKAVKVALSSVAGLGIFSVGFFGKDIVTHAGSSWSADAQNAAYSELLTTASTETNKLTKDTSADINNTINGAIQDTVDQQQAELQKLLDEYYNLKLQGMTSSDEFKQLEQQIKDIQASVLEAYKKHIDEAFDKAQSQQQ